MLFPQVRPYCAALPVERCVRFQPAACPFGRVSNGFPNLCSSPSWAELPHREDAGHSASNHRGLLLATTEEPQGWAQAFQRKRMTFGAEDRVSCNRLVKRRDGVPSATPLSLCPMTWCR